MLAWSSRASDATSGQTHVAEADPYDYYEPPKKKVDAIAEAWGIHEPEPFEEFSAGGSSRHDGDTPTSSIYAGREGHGSRTGANGKRKDSRDLRDYHRDQHSDEGLQMASRHAINRRSVMPPPQPVFVPDAQSDIESPLSSPPAGATRPDGPKRSRSIMQRIRKMREPPVADMPLPPSATVSDDTAATGSPVAGARPTHRSQHSFLGRFAGGRTSMQKDATTPPESPEAFVYIEDSRSHNKELPPPPTGSTSDGEVDGVTRKGSLLKRVRGVVKSVK